MYGPARTVRIIPVISDLTLNAERIGFEVARYREQGSCADFRPSVPRYPAAARRLLAQLVRCLIARGDHPHHARARTSFFAMVMSAA
jgi:hypothetical protein